MSPSARLRPGGRGRIDGAGAAAPRLRRRRRRRRDRRPPHRASPRELGVELLERPDADDAATPRVVVRLREPGPGRAGDPCRRRRGAGAGVELVSEIELAYRWEQERPGGPRPMLAITGTDGKTTTTLLAVEMLRAAGLRTIDAGNTSTPLVDAIAMDLDAFVVECTSFRLAWTPTLPRRGRSLAQPRARPPELAPVDGHLRGRQGADLGQPAARRRGDRLRRRPRRDASTARRPGAAGDVRRARRRLPGRRRRRSSGPTARSRRSAAMRRSLPHDLTNALAARRSCSRPGWPTTDAIAAALASFSGPPHRLEHVGTWDDVAWYNDSKATTPHAARARSGRSSGSC